MPCRFSSAILAAVGFCCVPPTVTDFESGTPGKRLQGWTFQQPAGHDPGQWEVVKSDGNQVLAQVDRTLDSSRTMVAIFEDFKARNVQLRVRLKVTDGITEQSGGLVWRFADPENYMLARLDVMEKRVCLYRVVRGNRIMFGMAPGLPLEPDTWYTLRVEHRDNSIKVYLDDEILLLRWHRHVIASGQAGLWVKGDSVVEFDDLRLTDTGETPGCTIPEAIPGGGEMMGDIGFRPRNP